MTRIDTDYLVVGAGATGMAFVDTLVDHADADVVMVDRHHRPGGHWNHAYPFVRLHAPSAWYGVNSRQLGEDRLDTSGPNAGLYERASGPELNDYYQRVLDEHLLASGKVRFLPMTDYLGDDDGEHRVAHRVTGTVTTVRVRRRLVDATHMEASVPATHTPTFAADPDATVIPINGLVDLAASPSGFTIIGAGKTGVDACLWLLDQGVDPDRIRWVRPRDAWHLDRGSNQPLDLLPDQIEGLARRLEAAAEATSMVDLFDRLEACGQFIRIDPDVEPTMFHCAMLNPLEVDELQRIERVVRHGRVRRIGTDRIVLDQAEVPTNPGEVHVDCSARGLPVKPPRPVFEDGRITLQQMRLCQPAFNAALLGFLEAAELGDEARNLHSPPNPYPSVPADWIPGMAISLQASQAWRTEPEVNAWIDASRLNMSRGGAAHQGDPAFRSSLTRLIGHLQPAIANLDRLRGMAEPAVR
jgi:hypothetical protein